MVVKGNWLKPIPHFLVRSDKLQACNNSVGFIADPPHRRSEERVVMGQQRTLYLHACSMLFRCGNRCVLPTDDELRNAIGAHLLVNLPLTSKSSFYDGITARSRPQRSLLAQFSYTVYTVRQTFQ